MTTDSVSIIISTECNPDSPRNWDNMGTMAVFHPRYNLGDSDHGIRHNDYDSWVDMQKDIVRKNPGCVILPLYLYDHSGISINTTEFNCAWDSGQVGFIFASAAKVREAYAVKRITKKVRERALESLVSEVNTYKQYLCGEVYQFQIIGGEYDGESCGGFYGRCPIESGMFNYIPTELHDIMQQAALNA